MKRFESPEIKIIDLEVQDVITTSGCSDDEVVNCPKDTGL